MKKYFITGLAILLPLALTILIVIFLINLLTGPFLYLFTSFFQYFHLFEEGFLWISGEQLQIWMSRLLILILFIGLTTLLGALTRWVATYYFIKVGDYLIHRIPFINTIYMTFQDVFKTLFATDTSSFRQVVMLPFPNRDSYTLGLVTKETVSIPEDTERVAVFVPTTPNPTSGYLLLLKQEDITFLDISVEDALKYVISCGVVLVPFKSLSPIEARKKMEEILSEGAS